LILVDKLMQKIIKKKEQALLFSQFTSVLNILEDFCVLRGIEYCRLDGTTPLNEREQYIDEFTQKNSKK
jgi:SWI/SNF-related matrix-associated actin-dependent regulator of chromatin subfamily A member 5